MQVHLVEAVIALLPVREEVLIIIGKTTIQKETCQGPTCIGALLHLEVSLPRAAATYKACIFESKARSSKPVRCSTGVAAMFAGFLYARAVLGQ